MKPTLAMRMALFAGALAALGPASYGVQTTYQVDLSVQIALGNFNPATDTVFVSGTLTSPPWQSTAGDGAVNQTLAPSGGNTNIYVGTFNNAIVNPNFENHKFVINPNNNFSSLIWEDVSGGGNRFFEVPTTNHTLPVVFFGDQSSVPSGGVPVTFRIDLGPQIALGNFTPDSSDAVLAAGAFNLLPGSSAWATDFTLTNVPSTTIYSGTWIVTNLSPGATVNHKFILNTFAGMTWENNGVGPNGAQNRQFVLPATATNLPVVFFNNVSNVNTLVTTQYTFQVNLSVPIARGTFDPSFGTVTVAGDVLNNWNAVVSPLAQSGTDSNLWTGTFNVTNAVGGPVNYKFTINNGSAWEDAIADRQFIFTNVATVLPPVFFNNLGNLGPITNLYSPGQLDLSWAGGPLIWLQSSTSLPGAWADVPETLGTSAFTTNTSGAQMFFRLKGP